MEAYFDLSVLTYGAPIFFKGALATITFCVVATLFGFPLGTLIALCRFSKLRILRGFALAFVEPFRNTPFLVQAFLIYFGLAQLGIRMSPVVAGAIILTIYSSALFAEAIRGGILSVPRGQMESARAVGMPYATAMRRIVFPQMLGYMAPASTNVIITLIKDSAALAVITVPELAMAAQTVMGDTFRPVEAYLIAAVVYWLITTGTGAGISYVANRMDTLRKIRLSQSSTGRVGQ